jgi:hypothetical protein
MEAVRPAKIRMHDITKNPTLFKEAAFGRRSQKQQPINARRGRFRN